VLPGPLDGPGLGTLIVMYSFMAFVLISSVGVLAYCVWSAFFGHHQTSNCIETESLETVSELALLPVPAVQED